MAERKDTCETSGKINIMAEHEDYPSPGTSEALQLAQKQKLIQESSWTKAVPYNHWHSYVKPTDSIGSIFTPGVHAYRTRILTKRGVKPARWHPFGADGVLAGPPHAFVERHNEEIKRRKAATAEKRRDSLPENIVSLRDLADDTWLQKKSRKARVLMKKELSARKKRITKRESDREVTRGIFVKLNECFEEQL
ncbi:PREDICTED: uncharacterized protein LOC105563255 [Vollenhovia emeryi]|uniref:uncharacterized protein LOC105563255 n=1 Tax=Vollenhovia emeryi TaxID=411798 RepID=UPI0005F43AA5|nr:PREDICTED: uncharacterized protein LOC105563255 [Vollenhovia emeryi]